MVKKDELVLLKKAYILYIKPELFKILFVVFISSLSNIIILIPPFLNGKIIDNIINKDLYKIIEILLILVFLFVFNIAISYLETYIDARIMNRIEQKIKEKMLSSLIRSKMCLYHEKSVGEYISRIENDSNVIGGFFISSITNLINVIVSLIVSGFFVFKISALMSVTALLSFPISLLLAWLFGKKYEYCVKK